MAYYSITAEKDRIEHIKKFGNIMVDLETLSTKTNASIIEIGAVEFNKETGEIGDVFNIHIDVNEWTKNERHVDGDTILWWWNQDRCILEKYKKPGIKLYTALQQFRKFYQEHSLIYDYEDTILWGNGSTMDITILQSAYEYFRELTPWKYWAVNDVRTIVNLNPEIKKNCLFEGNKHNSVDDCRYQIKYLVETLNSLKK